MHLCVLGMILKSLITRKLEAISILAIITESEADKKNPSRSIFNLGLMSLKGRALYNDIEILIKF